MQNLTSDSFTAPSGSSSNRTITFALDTTSEWSFAGNGSDRPAFYGGTIGYFDPQTGNCVGSAEIVESQFQVHLFGDVNAEITSAVLHDNKIYLKIYPASAYNSNATIYQIGGNNIPYPYEYSYDVSLTGEASGDPYVVPMLRC